MPATFVGKVVSNRMRKSVLVACDYWVRLPKYHTMQRYTRKLMAHDEQNVCNIGDTVKIHSCRPLSKRKAFNVIEIIQRARMFDTEALKKGLPSQAPKVPEVPAQV